MSVAIENIVKYKVHAVIRLLMAKELSAAGSHRELCVYTADQ